MKQIYVFLLNFQVSVGENKKGQTFACPFLQYNNV